MNNIIRFEERLYYGINSDYVIYYRPFSKNDELGNVTMRHIEECHKISEIALTYNIKIEPIYFYFVQL